MSAPQWTPGPWRVHVEPASGYAVSSDSVFVCGAGEWPESQIARANVQDGFGEREANARLIAAAPDMASILATTSRNLGSLIAVKHHDAVLMTDWKAAVDAALAKAGAQ